MVEPRVEPLVHLGADGVVRQQAEGEVLEVLEIELAVAPLQLAVEVERAQAVAQEPRVVLDQVEREASLQGGDHGGDGGGVGVVPGILAVLAAGGFAQLAAREQRLAHQVGHRGPDHGVGRESVSRLPQVSGGLVAPAPESVGGLAVLGGLDGGQARRDECVHGLGQFARARGTIAGAEGCAQVGDQRVEAGRHRPCQGRGGASRRQRDAIEPALQVHALAEERQETPAAVGGAAGEGGEIARGGRVAGEFLLEQVERLFLEVGLPFEDAVAGVEARGDGEAADDLLAEGVDGADREAGGILEQRLDQPGRAREGTGIAGRAVQVRTGPRERGRRPCARGPAPCAAGGP